MKTRKQSLKDLVTEADRLLQEKYVALFPECLVCGSQTSEMHHFVPKSQSNNLRYDPFNLIPLCRRCHARHHLSGDPSIVSTIIEKKGFAWNDDLQLRRHTICKTNKGYLETVIEALSQ